VSTASAGLRPACSPDCARVRRVIVVATKGRRRAWTPGSGRPRVRVAHRSAAVRGLRASARIAGRRNDHPAHTGATGPGALGPETLSPWGPGVRLLTVTAPGRASQVADGPAWLPAGARGAPTGRVRGCRARACCASCHNDHLAHTPSNEPGGGRIVVGSGGSGDEADSFRAPCTVHRAPRTAHPCRTRRVHASARGHQSARRGRTGDLRADGGEARAPAQAEPVPSGPGIGSRRTTGIWRVVRRSYSANPGRMAIC
jgi:hypothetical protein